MLFLAHMYCTSVSTTPPTTRPLPRQLRSTDRCNRVSGNSLRGTRSHRRRTSETRPDLERECPRARARRGYGVQKGGRVKRQKSKPEHTLSLSRPTSSRRNWGVCVAHLHLPAACRRSRNISRSGCPNLRRRPRTVFPNCSTRSNPAAPRPCPASR